MNPILNLQSLNPKKFYNLRKITEEKIFNNENICELLSKLFNDKPKLSNQCFLRAIHILKNIKTLII